MENFSLDGEVRGYGQSHVSVSEPDNLGFFVSVCVCKVHGVGQKEPTALDWLYKVLVTKSVSSTIPSSGIFQGNTQIDYCPKESTERDIEVQLTDVLK